MRGRRCLLKNKSMRSCHRVGNIADDEDELNAVIAGKKAAALRAERRSICLFRVLAVFIIGAVRVVNDNIVELEAA